MWCAAARAPASPTSPVAQVRKSVSTGAFAVGRRLSFTIASGGVLRRAPPRWKRRRAPSSGGTAMTGPSRPRCLSQAQNGPPL